MRVLTWHIHGSYLFYLARGAAEGRYELVLPVKPGRPEGYGGRGGNFDWPGGVYEVAAEEIRHTAVDIVLTQTRRNWEIDRHEICSPEQLALPRIHLEHDPPRESPTDTRHFVDDHATLLVHVTPFNALMWDSGRTPTAVIEHGVTVPPGVRWTGERERGVVVVNGLAARGRRVGVDVFARVRDAVPLDLAGMESEVLGGLGDIPIGRLLTVCASYRFLFNPIRYTSLGLAVCEAMLLGMPIVGLATTEMATAVQNDVNGYVDTDVERLIERMWALLADHDLAARLGAGARETARERFGIERFVRDWEAAFKSVVA
jgi:glycosyl transferase family 1